MSLSLVYNLRHLQARRTTSLLTIGGIALVLFVYVSSLMLAEGLRTTLSSTGSEHNAIVIRSGAQNEIQSGIPRDHAGIITSQPEIARDGAQPLMTNDLLVLLSLKKRTLDGSSNVNIRGVSKRALNVRDGIKLISGRLPRAGTQEVVVGSAINKKFAATDIGDSLRLAGTNWPVVGIFDAGNSGFSSEIWGDVDILMPAFKRDRFSSVTLRLANDESFQALKERLEADPRLSVEVKHEQQFYADQSRAMSLFIQYIGTFVTVIFSLAAIIGSMITMYSAVANRRREVGVLRAVGFTRLDILRAFFGEAVLLSLLGGCVGIVFACCMRFVTVSTTNFRTFSELSFGFTITPEIVVKGLIFSLGMGVIGALLPAWQASRVKIVTALRTQ